MSASIPPQTASQIVGVACLALVLVASFFVARVSLFSRKEVRDGHMLAGFPSGGELYSDDDGEATDSSQASFSNRTSKFIIVIGSSSAFTVSLVTVLLSYFKPEEAPFVEGQIFMLAWLLVLLQSLSLLRVPSSVRCHDIGIFLATSSLLLILGAGLENYCLALQENYSRGNHKLFGIASILQILTGAVAAFAAISLQRRPQINRGSKTVDAQNTCSVFDRYTFSWARPLLNKAKTTGKLEYEDLPELNHINTANSLQHRFGNISPQSLQSQSLWFRLIKDHMWTFIQQCVLITAASFAMITPQICMFNLLSLLEKRHKIDHGETEMWFWVAGLALSKVTLVILETWLEWISFSHLSLSLRSQMFALIFIKSMNVKDIKTVKTSILVKPIDNEDGLDNGNLKAVDITTETDPLLPDMKSYQTESTAEEPSESLDEPIEDDKSTPAVQEVVNLLGVDVPRVSNFCGYSPDLLGSLLKMIVAIWFLVKLIGWWSTIAGLSVPLLFQPLNKIANRHYSKAQEGVMMARDEKTHVVTEALHGIRQVKFSAIESEWQKTIMAVRDHELGLQRRVYTWGLFLSFCWLAMPILLGAAALATYAWLNGTMTSSVAFTALSVFSSLEWTLSVVPATITEYFDAKISAARIQQYLEEPDKERPTMEGMSVVFENASITWPSRTKSQDTFTLRNVNLEFPNKELSVIHGKTGSGKSLLLAAIIGEADLTAGKIYTPRPSPLFDQDYYLLDESNWIIPSAKAFVAQIPWIENASVKANILFGLPFNQDRYLTVLQTSALKDDLKMLPDGENTEIGASGINLSGGQRWRVTFARALYSRAGILVLDDIFSAVDAHVGRHILEQALLGELGIGRTRILVTHHIGLVQPWATYIVELDGIGHVQSTVTQQPNSGETGRYSALPKASGSLNGKTPVNSPSDSSTDTLGSPAQPAKKFVEEEKREAGRVKWTIYKTYMQASGGFLYWTFALGVFFLSAFTGLGRSYWLRIWTRYYDDNASESSRRPISSQNLNSETSHVPDNHLTYYLTIYVSISLFAAVLICVKVAFVFVAALRASRKLFEDLTYKVLHAPLRWLDTVPVGRILNRFVGDFILVDTRLGGNFQWFLTCFLSVVTIIISALFVSFMMIIPITFLVVFSLYYTTIYLDGARDLKRLESSSKSPIFELLGSILSGLATVRCFNKVDDYLKRMYDCIDEYGRSTWNLLLVSGWMSFRQGLLGACFTLCVAASVILLRGIDASLAGFAISFALEYSSVAVELVTRYANFELDMNSAERIAEYTEMTTEDQSGKSVPASWPSKGEIIMEDLEVSYAPDLPLVLKGLTFEIKPCQRVGIVGRTGSGKSTLTLSLFRFLEARSGRIMIDGLDISQLRLHDLRNRLAIIPQDPVLFSGTIRSNLDPFDEQSDATLFDALRRVYLLDSESVSRENRNAGNSQAIGSNINIFHNLSHPISRGGLNLSQGQRQLLCLARAIVKQPKIIILDEATSSIDMGTDVLIQRSIREQFRGSTLVVIAHRLSTIADFDSVVVMSEGRVEEFDSPRKLMEKKGAFWILVRESGEKETLEERIG